MRHARGKRLEIGTLQFALLDFLFLGFDQREQSGFWVCFGERC
jgi:hypothetical protein